MPLTPTEALSLTPKAAALVRELREALAPDADGERRLTRGEARRIVTVALALIGELVVQAID